MYLIQKYSVLEFVAHIVSVTDLIISLSYSVNIGTGTFPELLNPPFYCVLPQEVGTIVVLRTTFCSCHVRVGSLPAHQEL